jgi:sulfide:quinone oxidoreductase
MAKVIVMGAGLGGVACAYEMKKKLGKGHDVTVVGSSAYFEFTPSNPWMMVGWRTAPQTRVDLAQPLAGKGITWVPKLVTAIDAPASTLTLADGTALGYDYLVITTGPKLAFEEVPGLGPAGFTQSVCTQGHALQAWEKYQQFVQAPGPIVVGAAQGASCFGPAYESAMILDTDLRRRKLRDRVPMTYVTSEPYIGHMGLGGVGDSKGLMESVLRQRHINWITNARILSVEDGSMTVAEHGEDGTVRKEHKLPFKYSMVLPRALQSARLRPDRRVPAIEEVPQHLLGRRLRRDPARRGDSGSYRRAEDRVHDRVDGERDLREHRRRVERQAGCGARHVECDLPG